jgi:hypothetical protein
VKNRPCTPRAWLFSSNLWCAQVTVTPDASESVESVGYVDQGLMPRSIEEISDSV